MSGNVRQGWYPVKPPGYDAVWRAVGATIDARPRPIAPAALDLLRAHEKALTHFGGVDGFVEVCDAAATVTWALRCIEALLVIARAGEPPRG